jgi:hypothetical protein
MGENLLTLAMTSLRIVKRLVGVNTYNVPLAQRLNDCRRGFGLKLELGGLRGTATTEVIGVRYYRMKAKSRVPGSDTTVLATARLDINGKECGG